MDAALQPVLRAVLSLALEALRALLSLAIDALQSWLNRILEG